MDYVLKFLNVVLIILEVLLIFNLLILVHEIGHFLAAKWRGLYVDGFGIWFGKPLWQKKINGVTYSLGSIPAGGFVKLPQMAPMEAMEGQTDVKLEDLPPITPFDKIIVAFAGPLFSFGLAIAFAVIVWGVGRPVGETEKTTTVGYVMPDLPAAKAGFQAGDQILEVDGHKVNRWGGMADDSINWCIVRSEGKTVDVRVLRNGVETTLEPEPRVPEKAHWWNRSGLRQIGIMPQCTAVISKVDPGTPADKAGLKKDDRILEINGEKLYDPTGIYVYMKDHPDGAFMLTVQRGTSTLQVPFTPAGVKVAAIPDFPNSPAKATDLKVGDIVTTIDGKKLPGTLALNDYVHSHGGTPITLNVLRDGKQLDIKIIPTVPEHAPDNNNKPMIGVEWNDDDDGFEFDGRGIPSVSKPSPVEQIKASMVMIMDTLNAVFSPKSTIGFQQMGGPVMMMHAYYSMLDTHDGWKMALWFSVILNVNLALLNLLPIPVLDGGHIMLAIIEAIRRRPVNLKVLEVVQGACAVVIIGFMFFIVFFDVQDLPFVPHPPPPIVFKAPSAETSR